MPITGAQYLLDKAAKKQAQANNNVNVQPGYTDIMNNGTAPISAPAPKEAVVVADTPAQTNGNGVVGGTTTGTGTGTTTGYKNYDTSGVIADATKGVGAEKDLRIKQIEDMYAANKQYEIDRLQAKRNEAISRLNQQATTIKPHYEEQRNILAGQNQQSRNKFAEFLANRGLTRSGTAARGEALANSRLQSGLAGLGKSEAEALSEIERQKELANQDYEINYDAVQQKILSDKTNALLNENRYFDTYKNQLINDALNRYNNEYNTGYNQYKDSLQVSREDARNKIIDTRYDDTMTQNQMAQQGKVYDPNTKTFVDTYEATRQNKADYRDSISGLGSNYDYDGQINKIQNDGDPSNDYMINSLLQQKEAAKARQNQNAIALSELTGYIPASTVISMMSPEELNFYKSFQNQDGGYQAAINKATDPRQKALFEELRNMYLRANPDNPYYNTQSTNVMVPTLKGEQMKSNLATEAIQRAGLQIENAIKDFNLKEVMPLEVDKAKQLIRIGKLDEAIKELDVKNAPAEFKAKIDKIYSDISQGNRQLDISAGGLALQREEFKAKKDSGAYDKDSLGNEIKRDALDSKKLDDAIKRLDSLYVVKSYDPDTFAEVPKIIGTPEERKAAILALHYDDNLTDALLARYKIPTK